MTLKNLSYHHIVREPKTSNSRPPVLFMLHGYGSNEEDLFAFADQLPEALFVISARAPHPNSFGGYAWYDINFDENGAKWSDDDQARASRDGLSTFISHACKVYNLNENNVSVLGFSQGAILGYALALSYPHKVNNLIALSGYVNEKILEPDYKKQENSQLQIYSSHGEQDQVIPFEMGHQAVPLLESLNINHLFESYPVGHTVSLPNFTSFNTWLSNKLSHS